jgi:hypothetical protein
MVFNSIRNTFTFLGFTGTLGYFAGSKPIGLTLGVFAFTGVLAAFYFFEKRFRELRLRKGWYL